MSSPWSWTEAKHPSNYLSSSLLCNKNIFIVHISCPQKLCHLSPLLTPPLSILSIVKNEKFFSNYLFKKSTFQPFINPTFIHPIDVETSCCAWYMTLLPKIILQNPCLFVFLIENVIFLIEVLNFHTSNIRDLRNLLWKIECGFLPYMPWQFSRGSKLHVIFCSFIFIHISWFF